MTLATARAIYMEMTPKKTRKGKGKKRFVLAGCGEDNSMRYELNFGHGDSHIAELFLFQQCVHAPCTWFGGGCCLGEVSCHGL